MYTPIAFIYYRLFYNFKNWCRFDVSSSPSPAMLETSCPPPSMIHTRVLMSAPVDAFSQFVSNWSPPSTVYIISLYWSPPPDMLHITSSVISISSWSPPPDIDNVVSDFHLKLEPSSRRRSRPQWISSPVGAILQTQITSSVGFISSWSRPAHIYIITSYKPPTNCYILNGSH
jgi:hypothetical protein